MSSKVWLRVFDGRLAVIKRMQVESQDIPRAFVAG